jgi:hypothetical protein
MKHLLILLLLNSMLFSEILYKMSGNLELTYEQVSLVKEKKTFQNDNIALDLVINNDFYTNKGKFVFSPGFYYVDNQTYNSIIKHNVNEMKALYINELYYTHDVIKGLSVSAGVFPFRKGTFYELSFNDERIGNGIFNVIDVTMQGVIATCKTSNNIFSFGKINFDKYFKSFYDHDKQNGAISYDSYAGSGGYFIVDKVNYDNWYLEGNLYKIDQIVNGYKIISSDIASLAVSYDDQEVNGNTYYSTLTFSNSRGDSSALSPTGSTFINKEYYFGDFKTNGYNIMVGFKKEFDNIVFNKDVSFGVEYMYKSPGYHSLLAGKPISPYSYGEIGYTTNINVGLRLDKDNVLKLRYCDYDQRGKTTMKGLTPVSTSIDNVNNAVEHSNSVMLQWYSDF